jgi:hypothetical protein
MRTIYKLCVRAKHRELLQLDVNELRHSTRARRRKHKIPQCELAVLGQPQQRIAVKLQCDSRQIRRLARCNAQRRLIVSLHAFVGQRFSCRRS